jgi:zinc protease
MAEWLSIKPTIKKLSNGVTLHLSPRTSSQIVSMRVDFGCGLYDETMDNNGIGYLAHQMLLEGNESSDWLELATRLERYGMERSISPSGIQFGCMKNCLSELLGFVSDLLVFRKPSKERFSVIQKRMVSEMKMHFEDADHLAFEVFRRHIYKDTPAELRSTGLPATLSGLTYEDCLGYQDRFFVSDNLHIYMAGNFDEEQVTKELEKKLSALKTGKIRQLPDFNFQGTQQNRNIFVFKDRKKCSVILGHAGIRKWSADFSALRFMDCILGMGVGFVNRLAKRLREELGLCYHVFGDISTTSSRYPGLFQVFIGTGPDTVEQALKELRLTIEDFLREGPTEREMEDTKKFLKGAVGFQLETCASLVGVMREQEIYGLKSDFLLKEQQFFEGLDSNEIKRIANKHIRSEQMSSVVIGGTKPSGYDEERFIIKI